MSSVRMCDRCGTVFSERSENWSTFTGTTRRKNEQGQWVNVSDELDSCPECSEMMATAVRPNVAGAIEARTTSPRYDAGT